MVSILEGTLRDGASAGLLHERTYSTHGISLDFLAVVQKDSTNIRGIVLLVDPLTSAARADMLSTKTSTSPLFVSVESCQNAMVAASNSNVKMSSFLSQSGGVILDSCHGGELFLVAMTVPIPEHTSQPPCEIWF